MAASSLHILTPTNIASSFIWNKQTADKLVTSHVHWSLVLGSSEVTRRTNPRRTGVSAARKREGIVLDYGCVEFTWRDLTATPHRTPSPHAHQPISPQLSSTRAAPVSPLRPLPPPRPAASPAVLRWAAAAAGPGLHAPSLYRRPAREVMLAARAPSPPTLICFPFLVAPRRGSSRILTCRCGAARR